MTPSKQWIQGTKKDYLIKIIVLDIVCENISKTVNEINLHTYGSSAAAV